MDTKSETWPRLDLVKAHVTNMVLRFALARTPEIDQAMADAMEDDERFFAVTAYSKTKTPHAVMVYGHHSARDEVEIHLTLEYHVDEDGPTARQVRDMPSSDAWAVVIAERKTLREVRCHVDFEFAGDGEWRTYFPLPFRMGSSREERPGLPFEEIRGIRGEKLSPGERDVPAHSFILDRPTNEEILLHVEFKLPAQAITPHLPRAVLDRAVLISGSLILPGRN